MGSPLGDAGASAPGRAAIPMTRRDVLAVAAFGLAGGMPGPAAAAAPQGHITWGVHVSLSPTWFDPAETSGIITPFMELYALHDALVKPMPGNPLAPCLAESWSASEDGLSYDFVLRKDALFHNGDPVTAEDVKFSFKRYHGTANGYCQVDRRFSPLLGGSDRASRGTPSIQGPA